MAAIISAAERRGAQSFYVWMAGVFVLIAFGGFVPTYWARLASGSFNGAPILHIHGALFFTWTLFFLVQTSLVVSGRTLKHRDWGLAGIALATAMGCTVILAAMNSIKAGSAIGMGDEARRFTYVPLSALVLFWGFVITAIANVRDTELHKRCMILANIPLMHAAFARVFMTLFAPADAKGPPPVFVAVPPALCMDLLLVAAMVYDWKTRGKPHPAYLWGGAILLIVQLTMAPVAGSSAWMAIARGLESLAG